MTCYSVWTYLLQFWSAGCCFLERRLTEDDMTDKREKMIWSILQLIRLTSCVSGSLVVNVTQTSYQAEEDQDITLEWTFTTRTSTSRSINIYCHLLTDVRPIAMLHLHEGVEVPEFQDEQFAGRVQFDKDVLREGRVRLNMSRLRINDSGCYVCDMLTGDGRGSRTCHLNVTAVRKQLKPEGPEASSSPQPESRGRIDLYAGLGLTAAVLLGIKFLQVKYLRLTLCLINKTPEALCHGSHRQKLDS